MFSSPDLARQVSESVPLSCPECGAVTCRKCLLQAHGDRECDEDKKDVELKEVDVEYKKSCLLHLLLIRNYIVQFKFLFLDF